MDAIIGWIASIAALALMGGAVFVLLRAFPDVLENGKAKWSLIAGGGLIVLILVASGFGALFGSSTATQTSAEPRAWIRVKPMPSNEEIRGSLTYSANRYARSVQTPNDTSPNRWIGCDLWRNSINYRTAKTDGGAEGSIELRWLGTCQRGKVHGTGTLVFMLKDIDRPAQKLEVARVQLAVTNGVMATERDYREAWAQAIVTRTQRQYSHDVRSLLAGQHNYVRYLLISSLMIGVGLCLSYAAAAGRWNNANFVQFSDWWGFPTLFAIGFTQMWHYMFSGAAVPPAWIAAEEAPLLKLITGVAFITAIPCSFLYIIHVFSSIGAIPKIMRGLAVLAHFFVYRHPVEAVLPDDPFARVDRKVLRQALVDAAYPDRSGWKSFLTPSFVTEHRMFAGARVEDLLQRHAEAIQAALQRRRVTGAHPNPQQEPTHEQRPETNAIQSRLAPLARHP